MVIGGAAKDEFPTHSAAFFVATDSAKRDAALVR